MTKKQKIQQNKITPAQLNASLGFIIALPLTWALFHFILDPFSVAFYNHPYTIWWKIGIFFFLSGGLYMGLTRMKAYENMAYGKKD